MQREGHDRVPQSTEGASVVYGVGLALAILGFGMVGWALSEWREERYRARIAKLHAPVDAEITDA